MPGRSRLPVPSGLRRDMSSPALVSERRQPPDELGVQVPGRHVTEISTRLDQCASQHQGERRRGVGVLSENPSASGRTRPLRSCIRHVSNWAGSACASWISRAADCSRPRPGLPVREAFHAQRNSVRDRRFRLGHPGIPQAGPAWRGGGHSIPGMHQPTRSRNPHNPSDIRERNGCRAHR
jgi:hypothetical protein